MKANLLLLEDTPGHRRYISRSLREAGYAVVEFGRIDLAKEYFYQNHEKINGMVIDLNMSDEWLNEYQPEACGGILSGWVFLKRFVYPVNPIMPAVIYSGVLEYLEKVRKRGTNENIEYIDKNDFINGGTDGLVQAIELVIRMK